VFFCVFSRCVLFLILLFVLHLLLAIIVVATCFARLFLTLCCCYLAWCIALCLLLLLFTTVHHPRFVLLLLIVMHHLCLALLMFIVACCCNPSFGLVIKARVCKGAGQKWSLRITFHAIESVEECEGINPHIPKWTHILGIRLPMHSQIFKRWLQMSNLLD
jgi:hypothetical protein